MDLKQFNQRIDLERITEIAEQEKHLISDAELLGDETNISAILSGASSRERSKTELLNSARGWVYGCVDAIANEIGAMEILLFETKDGEVVEEIKDAPVLDLLHKANDFTTQFDLFYLSQQYLDLVGEAPWFLEFEDGTPINIFLLRPDRLIPIPAKKDSQTIISGYEYTVISPTGQSEIVHFEVEEIIYLRYPSPTKLLRGKGTLEAVARTFDLDETAEKYNLVFFKNAATPNVVFSTDKKLPKEKLNKLKRELTRKYEGFTNAHKTLILEGGLKLEKMALSQKEMDFISSNKFNRDKILAIFRVPKSVLGVVEDVNRANAEASDFIFAKRTIKPKMQKLIEQLNEFLLPFFDDTGNQFLDFEDPVPQNTELKLKQSASGVKNGYLTINEARDIQGFEPIEEGDVLLAPSGATEADEPTPKRYNVKKKFKKSFNYHKSILAMHIQKAKRWAKVQTIKRIIKKTAREKLQKIITAHILDDMKKEKIKKHIEKTGSVFSDDPEEAKRQKHAFQAKQLRVGEEFEEKFSRALRSIFRKQRDKVLAKFTKKQLNPDDFILNSEEEIKITFEKLRPQEKDVVIKQGDLAFELLGVDNSLSERIPAVTEFLNKNTLKLSSVVTAETNKRIRKVIADSVAKGDSIAITSQKIRTLFDSMEKFRADRIARSEIIRATTFATEESFVESGVVVAKEWVAFIDERTDDECLALDGKVIPLGKKFFDLGDKFGRFDIAYEALSGPPLHVNCRCTLVPVIVA